PVSEHPPRVRVRGGAHARENPLPRAPATCLPRSRATRAARVSTALGETARGTRASGGNHARDKNRNGASEETPFQWIAERAYLDASRSLTCSLTFSSLDAPTRASSRALGGAEDAQCSLPLRARDTPPKPCSPAQRGLRAAGGDTQRYVKIRPTHPSLRRRWIE